MKIALFPGSFDPITKGHEEIVLRAIQFFDEIYVAIAVNSEKKSLFPFEQRKKWIEKCFSQCETVKIVDFSGLTVDFCKKMDINFIIRGVRNSQDFQYEYDMAQMNKQLSGVETIFLFASPQFANLSSSIVRDIYINQGNYEQFLPDKCQK